MKKIALCVLIAFSLSGCGGKALPQITMADKDNNFDFPVGQQFQIVLPSNQSTGYSWQVDNITTGALEQVNNEYQLTDKYKTNIVGAGGEEIWTFRVVEVKRSHIVMKYRRPWDKLAVANDFLVTVNGNPGDDGLVSYTGTVTSASREGSYYFVPDNGEKFYVVPVTQAQIPDPGIKTRLAALKDTSAKVVIRGAFSDAPSDSTRTFVVSEIADQ